MPEVSVIMSTYNEKRQHLKAAIESVLDQTFQDYEYLIVLDNPENNEIRQCVNEYAQRDSRIKIISNEKNIGLTRSLNKAIHIAKGVYMSRMDADDIMDKKCLQKELSVIEKEQLDLISVSKTNIDENGKILETYINDFSPELIKKLLPYDNHINHPTVLVKLDLVRREGGYREIPSCEDYDLWMRMLIHGCRMRTLPDVLLYYRVRQNGIGTSNAYQQYISKHFVQKMYKIHTRYPQILKDRRVYEKYIAKIDMSPQKREKFNVAYKWFYRGMVFMKRYSYRKACLCWRNAICSDVEIVNFVLEKIWFQIRKTICKVNTLYSILVHVVDV